ncbi:hypothetical protein MKW98_025221 [Papaver atlanticum]|uniref:Peptidase A1 domain-containing protein n=1 Tax=Papaver atlanticum TaxID=357466 RepID=A0AAD4X7Q7_9MAGN|nr:hypothetical protein MKW98_025221 [Papaver atlanticum]
MEKEEESFKVKHKFGSEADRSLKELTVHDKNRHGRLLAAIDIPLGGDGKATGTGWNVCTFLVLLQFITHLSVFRIESLRYYLTLTNFGSAGYFVQNVIRFDQVIGNLRTSIGNASISFGCGMEQTGKLALSVGALDVLIGFGASNTSILSQLTSSGKTKKKFSHCLDGRNGGGIFVIGDVVQPIIKTTPLVPNATHYNVNMESVRVGNTVLDIPKEIFKVGDGKGTIIDSGTTLAYLPGSNFRSTETNSMEFYNLYILTSQDNLNIHLVDGLLECFKFDKSIDDSFPTVTFGFQNSLELKVYPHDYLILYENEWCFGWQDSGNLGSSAVDELIILGGNSHLTNKLVLYDLENQVLGLSDYNCSSTIGLKDEVSGAVNQVGSHDLSSSPSRNQMDISSSTAHYHLDFGRVIKLFLLSFVLYNYVY